MNKIIVFVRSEQVEAFPNQILKKVLVVRDLKIYPVQYCLKIKKNLIYYV